MAAERWLRVEYLDGTAETFTFPRQTKDEYELAQRLQEALNMDRIVLSSDGQLHIIPLTAIKRLVFSPAPGKLPSKVIQGASQQ